MKLTLLQLVQRILQITDGEDVSSVGETEDSAMAVLIANRAFEYIATHSRWRHFRTYGPMETNAALNELSIPDGAYEFVRSPFYYSGQLLTYLRPEEFVHMTIA